MTARPSAVSSRGAFRSDPAAAGEPFPLTDIQHAYWIGRSGALELGNVACHACFEWRLQTLDIARLEGAWNAVVARHGMLRAIVLPSGEQRILPQVPHYALPVEDLSALPPEARDARLAAIRDGLRRRVSDTARWPLFAVQITRLGPDDLRLHIDLDLLTVDVQSFHIILGEMERLYADPAALLPPLSISFRDYVLARQAIGGPQRDQDRAWWEARIPQLPAAPQLPLAQAPQAIASPDFVRRSAVIEAAAWRRIEGFAKARNLTTSAVLLAAYAETLAQWSRDADFCLNLTHFHREPLHPEVEGLVGDFTSVVIVPRGAPEAGSSFTARARALQRETWVALSHRAFSGIEVMRELARRDGNLRGAPMPVVFTSLLGLDIDALVSPGDGPALLPEPESVETATPQVWFDHQAMIRRGALHYNWITIDALFPDGMVAAMFAAHDALLRRLATDGTAWDTAPPALLPDAQRAVRARANATARAIAPRRLQDALHDVAASAPDRTALLWSGGAWSYGRLAAAANAWAHRLAAAGVAEGDRVVVCLPRGPVQIAAVLGALDAGAAYVPVAADTPAARLGFILSDTQAAALISDREDVAWPVTLAPAADEAPQPRRARGAPSGLAYIIYTSGSTGRPKGVALRHAAVWNTVADINRRIGWGDRDRVLGVSSLGFDLSVQDIFGTLAAGGALILCDDAQRQDPRHWLDLVRRHGATIWNSVPALLELLLDEARDGALPLRAVLASGDWVPLRLPERLRAAAPGCRFLALGGATEASIWSNAIEVTHPEAGWRSIPYGYPLANQYFRVLDREGRDRPDWVPGDLHIGGDGLAEGYWNNEALTQAAFIRAGDGRRLYRTGDLARYWPDGMVEFLGREDTQVKIAGHRIELGEIEAVLAAVPGIRDAVAVVATGTDGARRIAAFAVEDAAPPAARLPQQDAVRVAAEQAEAAVPAETLERIRSVRAAGDAVARIAIARTLAAIDAGGLLPDPRFLGLLHQWRSLSAADGDLDAAIAAMRALPAWPGADLLTGWIAACARDAAALLAGQRSPLELLFPGASIETAASLYVRNPAAEGLAAAAAAMLRAASFPAAPTVLEVGGGIGAATAPLLDVLPGVGLRYVFTDVSLFFLDAARERFAHVPGFQAARFDINRDPALQDLPITRYDLIVAANVLHDAADLPRTLGWLRGLLAPDGRLLLIEATENTPVQMITAGFLEGFGAFADSRAATGLPLLAPDAWRDALQSARFDLLHMAGDRLGIGQHVLLAQRRPGADPESLRRYLAERLPGHMVPASITVIDVLPLGANGKVDRAALAARLPAATAEALRGRAPATGTEQRVAAIWRDMLALPAVSAETNFFRSGGDSLLAIRLVQRLREAFGRDIPLRAVFEAPGLAELAQRIDQVEAPAEATTPVLLLFPGSDGSARVFAQLEAALDSVAEIRIADVSRVDPAAFARDPAPAAEDAAAPLLAGLAPGRPLLLGGWSSGAVLAAALAARRARAGRAPDGLVLIDPVDWQAHGTFATRAAALSGAMPAWLEGIVAGQIGALAAFQPEALAVPALCVWAMHRESDWPDAEARWARILPVSAEAARIAADHWGLLAGPAAQAVARAVAGFIARLAVRAPAGGSTA